MRTKSITRLLVLALVLMLTFSLPAQAESCTLCGSETGSDAYLCAACLLDLLAEKDLSGGMEIAGSAHNDDGSVTLWWDGGSAPYSVYYELLDGAPVPFGWTAATQVYSNAVTLTQLVPGMSYVFQVIDAAGHQAVHTYYAPEAGDGNDVGAKIRIHTRIHNGERILEYPWSASEIALDNGKTHGIYLKLAYSMLRKARHYAFTISVEAPNGFADVIYAGSITLNYGKSEVPAWGFLELDDYFSYLERYYGGIPTGEYVVTLSFNGAPACSDRFFLSE